jgi:hypothetical protein
LSRQPIKLIGERHRRRAINDELAFSNQVHQLDTSEHVGHCAKRLEAQHWPSHPFDRAMVLLDDVVEICDLPYRDRDSYMVVDPVDSDLLAPLLSIAICPASGSHTSLLNQLPGGRHVTLRCLQKTDCLAFLVDS